MKNGAALFYNLDLRRGSYIDGQGKAPSPKIKALLGSGCRARFGIIRWLRFIGTHGAFRLVVRGPSTALIPLHGAFSCTHLDSLWR
jgi:hypothetical protein